VLRYFDRSASRATGVIWNDVVVGGAGQLEWLLQGKDKSILEDSEAAAIDDDNNGQIERFAKLSCPFTRNAPKMENVQSAWFHDPMVQRQASGLGYHCPRH